METVNNNKRNLNETTTQTHNLFIIDVFFCLRSRGGPCILQARLATPATDFVVAHVKLVFKIRHFLTYSMAQNNVCIQLAFSNRYTRNTEDKLNHKQKVTLQKDGRMKRVSI